MFEWNMKFFAICSDLSWVRFSKRLPIIILLYKFCQLICILGTLKLVRLPNLISWFIVLGLILLNSITSLFAISSSIAWLICYVFSLPPPPPESNRFMEPYKSSTYLVNLNGLNKTSVMSSNFSIIYD
jgi:hypothetical protein